MRTEKTFETDEATADLAELAVKVQGFRRSGETVALCHGTFDLLHVGHIKHLKQASEYADRLVVTITADPYVSKGPDRPIFNDELRAEHLDALAFVDAVAVCQDVTSLPAIHAVRPDFYVKGEEYRDEDEDITGNITLEREAVEEHGGRIIFTGGLVFSSTKLLNDHFDVFTPQQKRYLTDMTQTTSAAEVSQAIDRLQDLKVLVVGDTIIDEYHYTSPLGQTGKYNVPAVCMENEEQFAGGAVAVANHVAGFGGQVTLLSALGETASQELFIRRNMKPNVKAKFFWFKDRPTVVKRRYMANDMSRLLEVYYFKDEGADGRVDAQAADWLQENLSSYDLVVVPDFGNGLIGERMVETLCEHAPFLAVNTQFNSGNRGFHVATRYRRADFLSLNEPELRLAAQDKFSPIADVARRIADRLDVQALAVTRGTDGVMLIDRRNDQLHEVPALSTKVVDRIGAGDAFLSLASLLFKGTGDAGMSAFGGSVAAALNVQVVCNSDSTHASALLKYVTTLLK